MSRLVQVSRPGGVKMCHALLPAPDSQTPDSRLQTLKLPGPQLCPRLTRLRDVIPSLIAHQPHPCHAWSQPYDSTSRLPSSVWSGEVGRALACPVLPYPNPSPPPPPCHALPYLTWSNR